MPKKPVNLVPVRKGPKTVQPQLAIDLMKKINSRFLVVPRNRQELVSDKRNWYFMRDSKGNKIGTVSIDLQTAEIGGFSVLPQHRNVRGSLSALKSAEQIVRRAGHNKAISRVNPESKQLIKVLQHFGYKIRRKITAQKYGVKMDLIQLEKDLT